jgi:hypothetical protein
MSLLQKVVATFLDQREEYVRVLRQCVDADADYHRWQGHAEARRQLQDRLADAGVDLTAEPRDESTVKADAIRELAQAQRQFAADARTNNGHAEHEDFADWLDEQADKLDPRRLEGAHP